MLFPALRRKIVELEMLSSFGIMGLRAFMLASKFILALFIVRYIGLADLGLYGLIGGACAVIPMVMRLGIFSNLARQAVDQPLHTLTRNLYHYGIGIFLLYALLFPGALAVGIYSGHVQILVLTFSVILFEHLCIDIFVIANNLKRPKLANGLLALQSAAWIYPFMALAYFKPEYRGLDSVLAFWAASGVITFLIVCVIVRRWPWKDAFHRPIDVGWYKSFSLQSWRIYVGEILSTVTIYMDRYLITAFLNLELTGVYVLFWQVTNGICNLVGAGILQMHVPRFVSAYNEKNRLRFFEHLKASAIKSLGSTYILCIMAGIVIPFLIPYTNHNAAIKYIPLLWMMLAALGFRIGGDICAYALYSLHRDDFVLVSVFLKLFMGLVVGTLSLYTIGIYGVVPTMIVTGLTGMLYASYKWKTETLI